jgi:hypothetical protein
VAFTVSCFVLQGSETKTFSTPETLEPAVALHEAGVCPGNLELLVPA